MRRVTGLAVTGLMLALASPAAAEGRSVGGGETNARAPKRAETSRHSIIDRRARLPEIPQASLVAGSPPPALRTVPVSDGASVGVGLFSIVGATEKELVRRRTDPSYSVRPKDGRVAAVGFQLRF